MSELSLAMLEADRRITLRGGAMYICVGCRREMVCDKNGVGADFGQGHVYCSDRFRCQFCGAMILATNKTASFDPEYNYQDEYLKVEEG